MKCFVRAALIWTLYIILCHITLSVRHQNVLLREREWVWSFTETIFQVDSRRGSLWFDRCGPTKGLSTQHFNLSRCHHSQTRGERERRVKLGWKERNDTRLSMPMRPIARGCAHTHTHMCTCAKTHIKPASQVHQSMSIWGTRLLPFVSPQTSQHSSLTCTTVGSSSDPLIVADDDTVHVARFNTFHFKWYSSAALHFSFFYLTAMDIECEFWIEKKKKLGGLFVAIPTRAAVTLQNELPYSFHRQTCQKVRC